MPAPAPIGPLDSKLTTACPVAPPLTRDELGAAAQLAPLAATQFWTGRELMRMGETKCERARADGALGVIYAHDKAVGR